MPQVQEMPEMQFPSTPRHTSRSSDHSHREASLARRARWPSPPKELDHARPQPSYCGTSRTRAAKTPSRASSRDPAMTDRKTKLEARIEAGKKLSPQLQRELDEIRTLLKSSRAGGMLLGQAGPATTLIMLAELGPRNILETLLITQMIGIHEAALAFLKTSTRREESIQIGRQNPVPSRSKF